MKFTGDLFVQARSIQKAANILQSNVAPSTAQQTELLWFLGLVAIRGPRVLRYDSTVDENQAGSVTDRAITALDMQGYISPDHDAGVHEDLPATAWKKAMLSEEVRRVLEKPPPIPKEFPQADQAASQRWLVTWDEVLHEIGKGDASAQFKELLRNRGLRGNKLLAGMARCSQEMGTEESGVADIVRQWDRSDIMERYLLASGLINNAFRPFLLVSMANQTGSLAVLEDAAFRTFTQLEFSLVTKAATSILKAQAHKVDVSEECLVDEEPDVILLAGLKVLKETNPRQGPLSLIETAQRIAKNNECLPQFFQSIVLKSANLRLQHSEDLVKHLNEIKTDLIHSGLCAKTPFPRRWLNTINRYVPDVIIDASKSFGPAATIYFLGQAFGQDPTASFTASATGGILAKTAMNWLEKHIPGTEKSDIDAAANTWNGLSAQWLNSDQVQRDFSKFWNAPKPFGATS